MNDARQNPLAPFHGWNPFGLLSLLIWPAWASAQLPDHFRERRSAVTADFDLSVPDTRKIVDLEEYRQHRLAKLNRRDLRTPTALRNDR
jgi:hypothetical protein